MITELNFVRCWAWHLQRHLIHLHQVTRCCVNARAPRLTPDAATSSAMVIARSELPTIPEMMDLEATGLEVEREEMGPNAPCRDDGSAGMFLNYLELWFLSYVLLI
jgi:hypothetical protein